MKLAQSKVLIAVGQLIVNYPCLAGFTDCIWLVRWFKAADYLKYVCCLQIKSHLIIFLIVIRMSDFDVFF